MHIVMAGAFPADPNRISGGVESVILYLNRGLQRYPDLELDVVTLDRREAKRRTIKYENFTIHYLPSARLPGYLSILANINQLRAKLIELKPDLIHAQVAGAYAIAAAKTGLPWVLTLHGIRFLEVGLWKGFLNKTYRGWFIKQEERRAIKLARHIISISPFIQETFNGQLRGNIYNIENPIDDVFFTVPRHQKPGQLLFAGRLISRKGLHILLPAFAELHQRMPQATLRLAGGSIISNEPESYTEKLKQFVTEAGLEKAVTFLGNLDESALLEEYADCSALVLSSIVETAPMVIMQAMAAGKAVVSTDAGGARYLVESGQTGLIVPRNDKQALADALYQVLNDESKSEAMGVRGREVARQRFHTDAVAAQTREVYYNILGQTLLQH